jgi:hypothetical protein
MTDSVDSLLTFAAEILTEHKTSITGVAAGTSAAVGAAGLLDLIHTGLSLLAIGAAVICTLALARYHRANERKMDAERELLELELAREKEKLASGN